ncbi:tartrate-resistant acid phosphatase type 5 [Nematostella vectensis]|uniref:tartrate-resistant acid phosphatase type 5 n=1 Tax=Nematostella vectensis TaxID=45351 RepID=UPI0020775267|nr:tartrate-resistant acid phosphatase type 5 [Nematostella vectensis]XP_048576809.1 tartrate-resistant acid phosphatase type 5 [Nematostella vectensis]
MAVDTSLRFLLSLCLIYIHEAVGHSEGKLSFLAVGDTGGIPFSPFFTPTERRVATVMGKVAEEVDARFVLGLGDNFYFSGVRNARDPRFRLSFEDVFSAPALHRATWCMIAGNHDYQGNVSAQIAYTQKSRRWYFPNFYYTFVGTIPKSRSTVQVVMIDTMLLCFKKTPKSSSHWKWIKRTLKKSSANYLIVAGHHPVFSVGPHGSTKCLRSRLAPLLRKYKVSAYLSGHDHNLQHIKATDSTVHYFVSGNGNFCSSRKTHVQTLPRNSLKSFYGSSGGFTLFEAATSAITVTQVTDRGERIHTAHLQPRSTRTPVS